MFLTKQCQESSHSTSIIGVRKDVVMWYVKDLYYIFMVVFMLK